MSALEQRIALYKQSSINQKDVGLTEIKLPISTKESMQQPVKVSPSPIEEIGHFCIVQEIGHFCIVQEIGHFCIVLFSALKQTCCVHVTCDSK